MTANESPVGTAAGIDDLSALADDAVALVRKWLVESREVPVDAAGQRLAGVLRDPHGLDFTVGFVDGVVRPEDLKVAAAKLKELVPLTPGFLPAPMRAAIGLGGATAGLVPGVVVPAARTVLRQMVRHLIVDARDEKLGKSIAHIRETQGVKLNINLLGEAILGREEAARRLEGTRRLLERDDVDYVSIKVSSTARGRSTRPSPTPPRRCCRCTGSRARACPMDPRSSSTSTWRSTRTSISRSRSSPRSWTAPSSRPSRPASSCRRTCPTPSAP
jgi:RHH-type proline utilization regulon transcriptional repressor/proline dehydrogenase/delta 1-pyrroline-5-carboxylate dehydrogenase